MEPQSSNESGTADCEAARAEPAGSEAPGCAASRVDPRTRRTRLSLQMGLDRLVQTREFERISVQDITDAAMVNRATFYAHYPDKFALLECLVASRFHELLAERQVVFEDTCAGALKNLILGVGDYLAQTLESLASGDSERRRQLEPFLETAIVAVVRTTLLEGLMRGEQRSATAPPDLLRSPAMVASAVSWAVYGAAKEWVHMPGRPESEQMAESVAALVSPLMAGVPSGRAADGRGADGRGADGRAADGRTADGRGQGIAGRL